MIKNEDSLTRRLDALESESAIRRLMANYLEARDTGRNGDELAAHFTEDGIWEAVGPLAAMLGRHEGREAIARRENRATTELMPFCVHFLTNEAITVHGDTAQGNGRSCRPARHTGRPCGSPAASAPTLCGSKEPGRSNICAWRTSSPHRTKTAGRRCGSQQPMYRKDHMRGNTAKAPDELFARGADL
jgi:hypothetical protein